MLPDGAGIRYFLMFLGNSLNFIVSFASLVVLALSVLLADNIAADESAVTH
jgi:hypothetical protein